MTDLNRNIYEEVRKLKVDLQTKVNGNVECWYINKTGEVEVRILNYGYNWGCTISSYLLTCLLDSTQIELSDYVMLHYKHALQEDFLKAGAL